MDCLVEGFQNILGFGVLRRLSLYPGVESEDQLYAIDADHKRLILGGIIGDLKVFNVKLVDVKRWSRLIDDTDFEFEIVALNFLLAGDWNLELVFIVQLKILSYLLCLGLITFRISFFETQFIMLTIYNKQ